MNKFITGDCVEGMGRSSAESVHLAFADPPFNTGYDYGGEYDDSLSAGEYAVWVDTWMRQLYRVLIPTGTFWLSIGDEWAAECQVIARKVGFHLRSWVIWYYTFGVNSPGKFTRSHAHLLYFTKHQKKFTFNADSIRVPSARAMVYNDKRANPDGRLPDDTWILRPQEIPGGFPANHDTWYFPRIAGSFHRRQPGAPNQMPEQLLGRIIRACSNPGDMVLDPFVGTGTTLVVAKKLNRKYLGYEISAAFAEPARRRICATKPGDPLDTPIQRD